MQFSSFEVDDLKCLPALQPADWGDLTPRFTYFIGSPFCKPVKLCEGEQVIGIGTSMMHEDTAWLACVIIHPDYRNKGLGNILTSKLISDLDQAVYGTIYLDATDFGYPVYKKLGFEVETEYVHLKRESELVSHHISPNIIPYREEFQSQLFDVDELISGERREGILRDFLPQTYLFVDQNHVQGFYIKDWGDGPVIALNDVAGIELMKLRSQHTNVAILPVGNKGALRFWEGNQFVPYKTSRRMFLGKKRRWKSEGIYNRISGQLG